MKIHFANVYGNTVDYFLTHSVPYAITEDGEEELALSQGWYRLHWGDQKDNRKVWGQAREARVDVSDFKWNRTPRKILKKHKNKLTYTVAHIKDLSCDQIFSLKIIFYKYLHARRFAEGADLEVVQGYQEHFEQYIAYPRGNRRVFMYYYESKLIAFSCFEEYPNSYFGSQFAWDFKNPELSLGLLQVNLLCALAIEEGKNYVYLGMAYGRICSYKSRFKGFEFWTGKEWSRDKDAYLEILKRDDGVKNLDDLEEVQDSMYKEI